MEEIHDNSGPFPEHSGMDTNSSTGGVPLQPETPAQPKRLLGALKGLYTLPENFEEIDRELDKEIERLFLGEDEE